MTKEEYRQPSPLADLRDRLRPVPGPSENEIAAGRRMLLSRLAAGTPRSTRGWRGMLLKPAGMLAGGLTFGALAIGAAAAGGVQVERPVQGLLQSVGVDLSEEAVSPGSGVNEGGQPSAGLESGLGGSHGGSVSDAVRQASEAAAEQNEGRGTAVREAACAAAKDAETLPTPAQAHKPEDDPSQKCPDETTGNANQNDLSGTPGPNRGRGNSPTDVPRGPGQSNGGSIPAGAGQGQGQEDHGPPEDAGTPRPDER